MRLASGGVAQGMTVDTPCRARPIYQAQVTDYMSTSLVSLFDNDCLDDQFFCDVSPDGKHIATGAYNKSGHVMDVNFTENRAINCRFKQSRDTPVGSLKVYGKNKRLISSPTSPLTNNKTKAGTTSTERGNDLRKRI